MPYPFGRSRSSNARIVLTVLRVWDSPRPMPERRTRSQLVPGTKPLFPRAAMLRTVPGRLSFDRVATIYDETRSLAPRAMARLLAVLVDELHRKLVLEIGVGTGRYAVPLQKSGIRVVGVDISRLMIEFGLAKGLRD